jgi:effector-binding domain-containing protein
LRVILIIILVLVAAVLIAPLFSPATAEVSAETSIELKADRIFPSVASFKGRQLWDPWLTQDSTAEASIESNSAYVGSTYAWTGDKVGSGRMEVISVKENEYIESHLWFGEAEEPALVEWNFEALDGATLVTWSFSQETGYPIERLGMMFGKMFLKQSFELGLSNLKELMESMKDEPGPTGRITVETLPAMNVLLADGSGTMEEIGVKLPELYGLVYQAAGEQGLDVIGVPFVNYLDYDEATGFSNYRAGIEVSSMGSDAALVKAEAYPDTEAVLCIHSGAYETLIASYEALDAYILSQGLEVAGNALEFYQVGAMTESDPELWKTLIAFPLK